MSVSAPAVGDFLAATSALTLPRRNPAPEAFDPVEPSTIAGPTTHPEKALS